MTVEKGKSDITNNNKNVDNTIIHVVGAIIIKDKKILATQRGYGDYAGWWEFPGGKIESGEKPEEALIREIKEELDADIIIDRFFGMTEYDYPKFHVLMRCFLCCLVDDDISLIEHRSALWLGRDNIFSVKWLGADLPIIEQLIIQGIV